MNRSRHVDRVLNRRSFLLLEVLIAFLILTVCLIPLIKTPLLFYRSEVEQLEKIERENLADWTFSEIKEGLYLGRIPWRELPGKEMGVVDFFLPEAKIKLLDSEKVIGRTFSLKCMKEKVDVESLYRIYQVKIHFTPALRDTKSHSYSYQIIVRKIKD